MDGDGKMNTKAHRKAISDVEEGEIDRSPVIPEVVTLPDRYSDPPAKEERPGSLAKRLAEEFELGIAALKRQRQCMEAEFAQRYEAYDDGDGQYWADEPEEDYSDQEPEQVSKQTMVSKKFAP